MLRGRRRLTGGPAPSGPASGAADGTGTATIPLRGRVQSFDHARANVVPGGWIHFSRWSDPMTTHCRPQPTTGPRPDADRAHPGRPAPRPRRAASATGSGPGALRPPLRARRLRRGPGGRPRGPAHPHPGPPGHLRPRAPGPPRGHRERGGQRGRRRHPAPDPPRLLRRGRGLRPARPRRATPPASPSCPAIRGAAEAARDVHRQAGRRGGPRGHRLARRAHPHRHARLDRRGGHALHAPAVRGPGAGRRAEPGTTRPWPSTGWPSSCASGPSTRSTSATSRPCRPGPSPTRGC